MTNPLFSRLQHNFDRRPEKPLFIYSGPNAAWQTVTYRRFAQRVDRFARGLASYGFAPGTRAVLMVPPSVDMFALVFALLHRGIVPVMVDPAIGLRNVTPCIAECQPQAYFGSALTHAIRRLFGWGRASLRQNLTLSDVARAGKTAPTVQPAPLTLADEAAIVYTSGSTGLPKGAIYTVGNFLAQIDILVNALQLTCEEIDLPAFPLFAMIDCLLGVTAIVPDMRFPPPAKVDPQRMSAAIQRYQVNTMFVSPAALARLARYGTANKVRLASLRKVITAGAPAPFEVQEQFVKLLAPEACLFGVYGSTEVLPISLVESREILQETRHRTAQGAGVCVGRPVAGAEVQIIPISDEAMTLSEATPLPVGEIGEITVKGAAVTKAYVAREAANRLAKITAADGAAPDGAAIHRMGDLGYLDEQGRLWYCGRKSQRVVTKTGTLFTEPVEGIFNAHPLVYRSALVGLFPKNSSSPLPVSVAERRGEGQGGKSFKAPPRLHWLAAPLSKMARFLPYWVSAAAGPGGEVSPPKRDCIRTQPVLWVELIPTARRADHHQLRAELLQMAKAHPMTQGIQTILFHPAFPTDVRHNSKIIREKLSWSGK